MGPGQAAGEGGTTKQKNTLGVVFFRVRGCAGRGNAPAQPPGGGGAQNDDPQTALGGDTLNPKP